MKEKLPNFLIVGAAKSGTTSLYHHLKQHPEIHMPSTIKETFFFTGNTFEDVNPAGGNYGNDAITSLNEYKKLFEEPDRNVTAIGEACVAYLYYYENSIKNICNILSNPKIIIILRNPVDRAFSNYLHHVRDCFENFSFEEALKLERQREKDNWWWGYQFTKTGSYYKQVNAYIKNFSHVKVYLYDDLTKNTSEVVKNMYKFLEVDTSFVPDTTTKYNISGVPKIKFFNKFLTRPNILKSMIKPIIKVILQESKRKKIAADLRAKNLCKPEMKLETREYLKNIYREDILRLQNLIKSDLSEWLV